MGYQKDMVKSDKNRVGYVLTVRNERNKRNYKLLWQFVTVF